jgi:hypothetical protein
MPAAQFEEWLASVQPPALSPFQSM